MTTEVITYKSGKFVFSSQFDEKELQMKWFETQFLYQTVSDLPILPELASRLHEELIKKSIFSTAAIEGNPLTEEAVNDIVDEKRAHGKERAEKEITNLKRSYEYLRRLKADESGLNLSEKLIKNLHTSITKDLEYPDNTPGQYRSHKVQVGDKSHGGVYTPPKIHGDVAMLMPKFIEWINSRELKEMDPLYRASLARYHLALIHPFGDGNGRTARLLEALILQTAGIRFVPIMLSNFYYKNMDDYYFAFSTTQRNKENDVTAFLKFSLNGVIDSLEEIKSRITYHIRILALRDYIHYQRTQKYLTRRQTELMELLVDSPSMSFNLKELRIKSPYTALYRSVTPITARRDINRLLDLNLIKLEKERYVINLRALDSLIN